jgi:hypothetical protein
MVAKFQLHVNPHCTFHKPYTSSVQGQIPFCGESTIRARITPLWGLYAFGLAALVGLVAPSSRRMFCEGST